MFDWKWNLSDIVQDKDVTVFSTFSCGGGSTMGYKRAGFKVLGNVEIDPRMNDVYVKNHHPKYNFLMDLREFNKKADLPDELYHLDILDGSPPCSTFSTAGNREDDWGREKTFREGQAMQTLDDLFFVFLETVDKLKPKIAVAENVTGLAKGNARGYINEIVKRFHMIGYDVQLFQFNSAFMDVPQIRERVFFIANNQKYPKLNMEFTGTPITFGNVRTPVGADKITEFGKLVREFFKPGDKSVQDINIRVTGKTGGFTCPIVYDNGICPTICASGGQIFRAYDRMRFSKEDIIGCSTFPQDYDFMDEEPQYICGMSVPPNMMANIASEIYRQWLRGK